MYYFWCLIDIKHLKCFVEVSKCTAESNERELLSTLYAVGENFATLIYDLPVTIKFDKFHEKCKSVLNVLKRRSYLIEHLVSLSPLLYLLYVYV